MRKLLFVLGAIGLLAASCSGSQSASVKTADKAETAQTTPAVQTRANVQVSNADDAVNLLEKNSSNEQASATESDDNDVTSSDSDDLSSMTEVSNDY